MRVIYISIVLLVLYGDLIKRYLLAQESPIVLYALAIAILFAIFKVKKNYKTHIPISKEGRVVSSLTLFLIAIYMLQLFTSFDSEFIQGLTQAIYMSIPLLFIIVVQRYCPQFDLLKLGNVFFWLMIPVNCVGFIQYFIDSQFLISSVYSMKGGIVARNLMFGGTFLRFPSLFTSADRYSAMGLMQLYFVFIMFLSSVKLSYRRIFWIAFNFSSASAALLIAGARSRILIAVVVLVLMAVTLILGAFLSSRRRHLRTLGRALPIFSILLLVGYLLMGVFHQELGREGEAFPVLTLFQQSFEERDIHGRLEEATSSSFIPDEITLFGKGLGTVGEGGRPGEFGIRSMWIESGLIWGSLLLMGFAGIVLMLLKLTYSAFLSKKWIEIAVYCVPLLLMIMALLTGLTSAFELSSGILLGCTIAVITRSSLNVTDSPPPVFMRRIDPIRRKRL